MPRSSSATSARRAAGTSCHLARLCHHRQSNCCHRPCKAARTHRRRYRRERREKHLCRYRCQTQPRRSDSIPQHLHGSRWAAHSASRRRMGRSAAETPATAVWGLMALNSAASLQDCRRRRWHQTEQAEVSPALQDCRRRRWHQALERAARSVQGWRAAPISTLAALRLGVAQTRSVGTARWVPLVRGLCRERRRRCCGRPASRLFAWPYRTGSRHSRKDLVMVDAPPFRRRDPIVRTRVTDILDLRITVRDSEVCD